ncbi:hypothetical protein XA68_15066 [Ophiocordyceps unilateralis]|uniref:Uncharacterized protein n=1 Tax=Ophiocordyceps unilateralis TaxID=268505 RepID=A0A2A9PKS8_OPHUN|nr:hypothetical protein XA68_15066 [Ophiocordyceps unilateralis]
MAPARGSRLARFLSDFTLGFSDGLTVPFALTAGLSSLGRTTDTVVYAGLAELCAGSISMGIGGYLSAVDHTPSPFPSRDDADDGQEELAAMLPYGDDVQGDDEEMATMLPRDKLDELLVRRHLEPLALSGPAVNAVLDTLRRTPEALSRARRQLRPGNDSPPSLPSPPIQSGPVVVGLAISLGYLIGGIVPLSPYFFAPTVGLGLGWSIGLCLVALMTFGFTKSWVLMGEEASYRRCLSQGLQMLVLGSLAAAAAVLCLHIVARAGL